MSDDKPIVTPEPDFVEREESNVPAKSGLSEKATPGILAHDLHRAFGEVRAVDGVTFEAPQGAVTALIGPNGSGKTTLLLILAGLLKPDSGQAQILGKDVVTRNLEARSVIGWMPDAFGTWDALTCLEILTTFGMAYGLKKSSAMFRAEALLEQLFLGEFTHSPARVLSRGQKQRLGLARALIHDPQVLLLDEPASGLDPRSRIDLREIVRGLAEQGKTVLISSHVLSELEEFTDHAVFLSKGRTVEANANEFEGTARGWRASALDPAALRTFLTSIDIPWREAPGGEVLISLGSTESAAQLVTAAVRAGVPLHTLAPMAGRLEETYLQLNEERR
ncbi:MAG: ABC transporter ATP-binding protein [Propionibacteriaceae bacterium]|jgi:ABC-type multidrug transport system ATPase subunit|nr:ABC transporter ATP-binding protein [Propionibacteriaceae bacterium]